jgi:hypothetical protein
MACRCRRRPIGQFGHHLYGIAEGRDDIIVVILFGRNGDTLARKTSEQRVRGNMYARNHDDLLTAR